MGKLSFLQQTKWVSAGSDRIHKDLTGRVIIVTGASAGLGEESAKAFAVMNPARLILAVRSQQRGEAAKARIEAATGCKTLEIWIVDLADFASVKAFGKRANAELDRCDIFLQNAGLGGFDWKETKDGYERTLQVNVISTYWLGELLLPLLERTATLPQPSSIVFKPHMSIVGSFVHFLAAFPEQNEEKPLAVLNDKSRFGASDRYNVSKLLVLYATRDLADKAYPEVVVNFNNPGFAMTEFTNEMSFGMRMFTKVFGFFFARTAQEGAKPLIWASLNDTSPAAFISNCQEVEVSDFALSKESDVAAKRFMDEVKEIIKEQDAKHS